jgi:hypothetical protein
VYVATTGEDWEFMTPLNVVALFYNLRDFADAFPDGSGKNSAISSGYKFEAVPAFVVGEDGKAESAASYQALLAARSPLHRVAELN